MKGFAKLALLALPFASALSSERELEKRQTTTKLNINGFSAVPPAANINSLKITLSTTSFDIIGALKKYEGYPYNNVSAANCMIGYTEACAYFMGKGGLNLSTAVSIVQIYSFQFLFYLITQILPKMQAGLISLPPAAASLDQMQAVVCLGTQTLKDQAIFAAVTTPANRTKFLPEDSDFFSFLQLVYTASKDCSPYFPRLADREDLIKFMYWNTFPVSKFTTAEMSQYFILLQKYGTALKLARRAVTTTSDAAIAMINNYCPLDSQNPTRDLLMGCAGGIQLYCQDTTAVGYGTDFSACHNYYETVYGTSRYRSLVYSCASWMKLPEKNNKAHVGNYLTAACNNAVKSICQNPIFPNSCDFSSWSQNQVFASQINAPCGNFCV